jgi:hypothetical protein
MSSLPMQDGGGIINAYFTKFRAKSPVRVARLKGN